jgi:plastocyanin
MRSSVELYFSSLFCFLSVITGYMLCIHDGLLYAQTGSIEGMITLRVQAKSARVLRGNAYRAQTGSVAIAKQDTPRFDDVIISMHPLSFKANPIPAKDNTPATRITQQNATFIPHVLPVVQYSTVYFTNEDPFYHNVFSVTPGAKFNVGRRAKGEVFFQQMPDSDVLKSDIKGLGEIRLFCDIHSQMNAVILSLDTPYFTRTRTDGAYSIAQLPAGRYELRVYHPDTGTSRQTIEIKSNEKTIAHYTVSN